MFTALLMHTECLEVLDAKLMHGLLEALVNVYASSLIGI